MQESKYLQELTIGEGHGAPFVLAQSDGKGKGWDAGENDEVCCSGNEFCDWEMLCRVDGVIQAGGLDYKRPRVQPAYDQPCDGFCAA